MSKYINQLTDCEIENFYTDSLNDLPMMLMAIKAYIVKGQRIKEYNAENQGLEFTERVALTVNVQENKNPYGISYDARQRFDINVASWRGIAYIYIGTPSANGSDWNHADKFTALNLTQAAVKPVTVVNTVSTKEQA